MKTDNYPNMSPALIEFNHIYKDFNDIYHDLAIKLNMSDSIFDIFYYLCEAGDGCMQRDICRSSCLPKQTVNSSIRELEQQGYLTLTPGKGRGMYIYLTETGKQFVSEKIYPVIEMENNAFSSLKNEECELMLKLYQKYNSALREELSKL